MPAPTYKKPTSVPAWAYDDPAYREAPTEGQRETGWLYDDVPPFNIMNWLQGLAGDWISWLDERFEDGDGETGEGLLLLRPYLYFQNDTETKYLTFDGKYTGASAYIRTIFHIPDVSAASVTLYNHSFPVAQFIDGMEIFGQELLPGESDSHGMAFSHNTNENQIIMDTKSGQHYPMIAHIRGETESLGIKLDNTTINDEIEDLGQWYIDKNGIMTVQGPVTSEIDGGTILIGSLYRKTNELEAAWWEIAQYAQTLHIQSKHHDGTNEHTFMSFDPSGNSIDVGVGLSIIPGTATTGTLGDRLHPWAETWTQRLMEQYPAYSWSGYSGALTVADDTLTSIAPKSHKDQQDIAIDDGTRKITVSRLGHYRAEFQVMVLQSTVHPDKYIQFALYKNGDVVDNTTTHYPFIADADDQLYFYANLVYMMHFTDEADYYEIKAYHVAGAGITLEPYSWLLITQIGRYGDAP